MEQVSQQTETRGKGYWWTIVLMNLWVYPLLLVWTLIGILLSPLLYVLWRCLTPWPPAVVIRHFIWLYGRGWLLINRPFVRFSIEGAEQLCALGPAVLVVNHLSFFDTYCMALLPISNIVFAVRSWPFRMWWYRRFMLLARYLNVEAGDWEILLKKGRQELAKGGTLLFFPEGHRSKDGKLQRFYAGAFQIAAIAGVPVVPLCLTGTDLLLSPGRRLLRPCTVKLRVLEPIIAQEVPVEEQSRYLRQQSRRAIGESLGRG
ncbi:1-acyl-sn-glycerol-3-phosphate acyltransferase [Geothermobacter hydrogeniphilus]|uniref:1-acyl-sn-glycerol-3-phosphate acyltransferase n=1 Tax=Geothermobacter hydrogeniphilus TaxID=1969733 RepID=A0A2K2HBF5_9BACT|nr:lysophospholipid acyltransferase family protein [Geothermobacter hydrogeniphilus]PNU20644.1 1-acyl-sn-glycerol-3-phosphate acyltransferase [Geothermobacter hydrogeniphilus]